MRCRRAIHARGSPRSQLVHREADRSHQGQAYAGALQCHHTALRREISESLEALIEALKDQEYLVKSNAMVAIAAYGKQVSDRIIQALSDADKDVRAGAAWIIGELKDNRASSSGEGGQGRLSSGQDPGQGLFAGPGKGKKKQEEKAEAEEPKEAQPE